MVVIDTDGCVVDANLIAGDLLGIPLLGRLWRDIISTAFRQDTDTGVRLTDGRQVEVVTGPLADGRGQIILLIEHKETGAARSESVPPCQETVSAEVRERGQEMVAVSQSSKQVQWMAERVAKSEATVMLCGESGVGKEVMARFIHHRSRRSGGPFVAINCAAIPDNMLEATLFGYEKGAFTGAYNARPGKFEEAQGGTLLLDEVSEMDISLQAKLLRVLQEREVERLGGRKTIALDVRVLATSNRRLRDAVADGSFREDLYYRLNVFPLNIPPLRERRDDILPLMDQGLKRISDQLGRSAPILSEAAILAATRYDWPGNVRELENVLQRALILQQGDVIDERDLQLDQLSMDAPQAVVAVAESEASAAGASDLKSLEQAQIIDTLRALNGNRKETARQLGISERTLRYKLARMRESGVRVPGLYENSLV
ncbi:MAG: AAA domain-containing protein [Gammaproteobacteria bacterium]|nr:AAA domain-containing protein [Gammaproteobacteria bacterium]